MEQMITVFSKPRCVQCDMTRRRLDAIGVEYSTVDLTENEAAMEWALEQGFQQAPIVVVGDPSGEDYQAWTGFDPDRIKALTGEEP